MAIEVLTPLIGSGIFADGYLLAYPLNPWVVWNGVASRSCPKRFKIQDNALFELDGVSTARIPPTYISSGAEGNIVVFPDNNQYVVDIFTNGRPVFRGFWRIPYAPSGVNWYEFLINPSNSNYTLDARYTTDSVKTYGSLSLANADEDNIIEGTIIYIDALGEFFGKGPAGITPFSTNKVYPYLASAGFYFTDDDEQGLRFMASGGYLYLVSGGTNIIGMKSHSGYITIIEVV